jgi:hypothetical protein
MALSTPPPAVKDLWDNAVPQDPTPSKQASPPATDEADARLQGTAFRQSNGDVVIPSSAPNLCQVVLGRFGTPEATDATLDALTGAQNIQDLQTRAAAAEALLKPLQVQVQLVPRLQATVAGLQADCDNLRKLAQGAQSAPAKPPEPALDDQGKPLGEFQLLAQDPHHTDVPWAKSKLMPRLKGKWGQQVIALIGGAGTSKTWTVEQLMAAWAVPTLILQCHSGDPNDWYAYRSVENGETKWTMGRLARAIIDAGDKQACIFVDEFDTLCEEFKVRCLSLFNTSVIQRRMSTEAGTIQVGPNIQFVVAMNGNGSDPGSRHRGTVPQAIFSRVTWIEAEMMTAAELQQLLAKRFPLIKPADLSTIASVTLGLMTLQNRRTLDADITVRTAVKVCQDWDLGSDLAWAGALTDGLSDPKMRGAALGCISTGGKV